MEAVNHYTRALKTLLAAGAMLLATLTAAAQQEVAPDHFDGTESNAARTVKPAKVQKQAPHKPAKLNTSAKRGKTVASKSSTSTSVIAK